MIWYDDERLAFGNVAVSVTSLKRKIWGSHAPFKHDECYLLAQDSFCVKAPLLASVSHVNVKVKGQNDIAILNGVTLLTKHSVNGADSRKS